MEHQLKTTKTIKEKNVIVLFFLLLSLLLISTYANAQFAANRTTFSAEDIETHIIKEFKAKEINGIIYFRFLILENRNNIKYILESSTDGKDFSPLQTKKGFPSPAKTPLLYCYKVKSQNYQNTIYRVKIVAKDGTDYSKTLNIYRATGELTAKITN